MQSDSFVNISYVDEKNDSFYKQWIDFNSARSSNSLLISIDKIRSLHPNHSVVSTTDSRLNVLNFPGASAEPREDTPLLTQIGFAPLPTNAAPIPGRLVDSIQFGSFDVSWQEHKFIVYIFTIPMGFVTITQTYILSDGGSEQPARDMLLAAGLWADALHNEIWVFNQGFWRKDGALWRDVQSADWEDVILDEKFKKSLQKDIYGFFSAEKLYKDLGIPWKRGLIMHGPPGNGKTISIKAIMKSCDALGFKPLYVKSFTGYGGDEASMATVFSKARQVAPCVVILEDLDSLITDRNRSFFLNQMDGLQGNDGLLVIGTTNHFDKLDPGLSTRPSRFDRKFLFDDPTRDERAQYAVYWQKKLANNDDVSFPDKLVSEIADATDKFSFAYLKEAFVSSLVLLAGVETDDKPTFKTVILDEIAVLRKQLDKSPNTTSTAPSRWNNFIVPAPAAPRAAAASEFGTLLERLSDTVAPAPAPAPAPPPVPLNDARSLFSRLTSHVAPPAASSPSAPAVTHHYALPSRVPPSTGHRYVPATVPNTDTENNTDAQMRTELRDVLDRLNSPGSSGASPSNAGPRGVVQDGQFRALFDGADRDDDEDFVSQLRAALSLSREEEGRIRL